MTIKLLKLDAKTSQEIYDIVASKKEIQLNDCYLNTLAVAGYLNTKPKLAKEYKVVYGYMQGVSAAEKGYEDWQYNSYVRHAFLVDRKNRVVDISYTHLHKLGLASEAPQYISMKKYTLTEYGELIQSALAANLEKGITDMDISLDGDIPNEKAFEGMMKDAGYHIVSTDKETKDVNILNP